MNMQFGPVQNGVFLLLWMFFVISIYDTISEYVSKKRVLSSYVYKIVKEISTGIEYTAIGYSLNLVGDGVVYITDVSSGKILTVHPNEIQVVKEVFLIGSKK